MPLGWLIAGAIMSVLGFAIVTGTFADMRRLLPQTVYVRVTGLRSFDEFYDVVMRLQASMPAATTTATAFDAQQQRGDVRLDGLSEREVALRLAARRATQRLRRTRRTAPDRIDIDLD